jgi:hypothetical protein
MLYHSVADYRRCTVTDKLVLLYLSLYVLLADVSRTGTLLSMTMGAQLGGGERFQLRLTPSLINKALHVPHLPDFTF